MDYLIAIFGGSVAGLIWEYLANKPFSKYSTLVPSQFVKFAGKPVHLHHWLLYVAGLLFVVFIAYKSGRINHPAIVFVISTVVSALLYGFLFLSGWGNFYK